MNEELWICPKANECKVDYCNHKTPHKHEGTGCHSCGTCYLAHIPCGSCIPYPPEPELWVCDHADECPNTLCVQGKSPNTKVYFENVGAFSPSRCHWVKDKVATLILYQSPKKEPPMWELIKPVSIRSLEDAGMPERELHRFAFLSTKKYCGAYHYNYEFPLDDVVDIASQCEGGIAFLIKHGFIREREREKTYKRGDIFRVDNDSDCILSYVGDEKMVLVVISDNDKGNYWHHAQLVKDAKKVTEQEMLTLTQNKKFELIK